MRRRVSLSLAEARRIACAAQGFDSSRPACAPDTRHFRRVMETLRLLQLDFVNVLVPAHYLVVWSRLGAYDPNRLHRFLYRSGQYVEHWAHEASIVPADYWPVLAYRRRDYRPWPRSPVNELADLDDYLDMLLRRIEAEGGLTASAFDSEQPVRRRKGDWHRSLPRHALEVHFGRGSLAVDYRMPNFQRVYDLPQRVLPAHHDLPSFDSDEAHRVLLADAARAFGVATADDLADYFRMSPRIARPRIEELAEAGEITPIAVEGWDRPAYLSRHARLPRSIDGASLVSPFDPLIWYRPRTERLFGLRYRIEIYVPESKRQWGYYVLPFREGERLTGRLDLKADRQNSRLLIRRAYVEAADRHRSNDVAVAMADELRALSRWLQLEEIETTRHNTFSRKLAAVVA